jgi:hypothetical protein
MVRWQLMGCESGDCTKGSAVMLRLSRFSTRATEGDIEASFGSHDPGPEKTTNYGVSTRPIQGVL